MGVPATMDCWTTAAGTLTDDDNAVVLTSTAYPVDCDAKFVIQDIDGAWECPPKHVGVGCYYCLSVLQWRQNRADHQTRSGQTAPAGK